MITLDAADCWVHACTKAAPPCRCPFPVSSPCAAGRARLSRPGVVVACCMHAPKEAVCVGWQGLTAVAVFAHEVQAAVARGCSTKGGKRRQHVRRYATQRAEARAAVTVPVEADLPGRRQAWATHGPCMCSRSKDPTAAGGASRLVVALAVGGVGGACTRGGVGHVDAQGRSGTLYMSACAHACQPATGRQSPWRKHAAHQGACLRPCDSAFVGWVLMRAVTGCGSAFKGGCAPGCCMGVTVHEFSGWVLVAAGVRGSLREGRTLLGPLQLRAAGAAAALFVVGGAARVAAQGGADGAVNACALQLPLGR